MSPIIRYRCQRFAALHALLTGQFPQAKKRPVALFSHLGHDVRLPVEQAFDTTHSVVPPMGQGRSRG